MLKPCSRIVYLVVLLALLAFGFAGCGGDGGLGGGIGGGAGNTPVISGTIDALSSSGRIVGVGSTDATGVVSITASKLSGVTYPLVLELYGGTGFAGTMYSVMETSGTSSVYFSAFSTLWIKTAKAAAGSFEDITQAHLDAAKADVQSVYALLTNNPAATDFTTINPLASAEMAMVHQVFDADSGAGNQDTGYTGFDAAIDSMVTGLTTAPVPGPLTAITSTFQTATSAAALLTLIQEVSSSTTAQAAVAAAYPQLSTTAISTAASTLNSDASGTSAATSLLGKITVTSTVDDAGGAVPFSATPADNLILYPSQNATRIADDSTFYVTTYSVMFADGTTSADNTVTVKATTTSGTVSIDGGAEGASATGDCTGGDVAVKIIAPTTDVTPGNATFTLTFTTASGSTATVQNTIQFFDETVLNPSDVSCDVTPSAAPSKLLELSATALTTGYNTTDTFAVSANLDGVGTGSFAANTYKINFYPPAGTKFFDGTNTYDNYLVPVGAVPTNSNIFLTGADGLGSDPMIYVPTAKRSIGSSGTFRAVVTDWTGAPLSPSIYGASTDSYYQVDDADRLKEIQLKIDKDLTGAVDYSTLRTQTGLVDQATVNMDSFQATLVTWRSSTIGGNGAYSNSWITTGKTTESFALKVDRGSQGFVADAQTSGNYDVTSFIDTTAAVQTITDGTVVGADTIDLDYIAQMTSGDDNKDVITLVWKYIDGSTVKTMTSTPVTFQGKQ
jgi:hypothetical protein